MQQATKNEYYYKKHEHVGIFFERYHMCMSIKIYSSQSTANTDDDIDEREWTWNDARPKKM